MHTVELEMVFHALQNGAALIPSYHQVPLLIQNN